MLMPLLKNVVDYVVQKIWNENRELVRTVVYESYQPTEYDRTGQFKEAWSTQVKTKGNMVTGEFYYDPDKLDSFDGHHESIVDGQPMQDYLAEIIYEGLSGAIYQKGYAKYSKRFKGQAWTKKRDAWKKLLKRIGTDKMKRMFEEGMRQQGLKFNAHASHLVAVEDWGKIYHHRSGN